MKRRFKTILLCGVAALAWAGCSKDKGSDPDPVHDVELNFSRWDFDNISTDTVEKYLEDPSVRDIYLVPFSNHGFNSYNAADMYKLRRTLERAIMLDPERVHGRGSVSFMPGAPAKDPADSLWFVNNGWQVNPKE